MSALVRAPRFTRVDDADEILTLVLVTAGEMVDELHACGDLDGSRIAIYRRRSGVSRANSSNAGCTSNRPGPGHYR